MGGSGTAPAGKVIALVSGGLDSAVLLAVLARSHEAVRPVFIRCGLAWEEAEAAALGGVIEALRDRRVSPATELSLPMGDVYGAAWYASGDGIPGYSDPDERWEIPGRNLLLCAKAAVWGRFQGIGRLALGILASNPFPDATPAFFAGLEACLSAAAGMAVEVLRPFAGLHKADVVRLGTELGAPLGASMSCARPTGNGRIHCGTCGKCRERIEAFREAGAEDPTEYGEGRLSTVDSRQSTARTDDGPTTTTDRSSR